MEEAEHDVYDASNENSPVGTAAGTFDVELRYIGRRLTAAAIGLINLMYNLARYESRFRIGTATNRRLSACPAQAGLKSEDQNPKRPKTNQLRRINRQENTTGMRR